MTFTYLTTSVIFKHGPRPNNTERRYIQDSATTTAGIRKSQDYRAVTPLTTIVWDNMPLEDRTALEAFFELVNGMALTWSYTPSNGATITVRFGEPQLTFTEKYTDVFATTVILMAA